MDKIEIGDLNKHRSWSGSSSPRLNRYIGLTILYKNKVYSKHTFLKLAKEPEVLEAIASKITPQTVWDGFPAPFCKLVLCSDIDSTMHLLRDLMTSQEIAILAQFFSLMDSINYKNVKLYHNYFSELINRKKKDMFGLRGWKQQIYIHLVPLRDLSDQSVKILVCGQLIETDLSHFTPLLYPYHDKKRLKYVTRDLWAAHPNYKIRDIRFGSYSTKIDDLYTDVYYSFYTSTPSKIAQDFMIDCQSGEYDPYETLPVEGEETLNKKSEVTFDSVKLPQNGYGNNFAKHETGKMSLDSINRQVTGKANSKPTKWEQDKKLKTSAEKFFS